MDIKNAQLGTKVYGREALSGPIFYGEITDFWVSEANRMYAVVKTNDGRIIEHPVDSLVREVKS